MRRTLFCHWLMVALLTVVTPTAWAQFQGGGRTSGGGNTVGGNTFGGSALGGSSFGNSFGSGLGGNSFGTSFGSGFGSSFGSGSGSGFGTSAFGTSGFGTSAFGGQGFGQSMSGGAQGGQAFVGRDSGDMQAVFNQLGRSSNQFFQQLNRTMGGANRNNRQTGQQENQTLPVRVRLDVAFDYTPPRPTAIAATVRNRLRTTLARRSVAMPEVEIQGDTVILTGTATSESQRLVIEKLVAMEPGVSAVVNRITVEEPSPSPSLPPAENN